MMIGEAPPVGADGADAETARMAVLLATRALGTNAARVDHAERKCREVLEVLDVLKVTREQKGAALVRAASQGKVGAVKRLLADGVDPNTWSSEALDDDEEEESWETTALMAAAQNGHLSCTEVLLTGGASVNAQDEDGWTALHGTAWGDSSNADPHSRDCRATRVATMLLEAGADKTLVENINDETALMLAAKRSQLSCVKVLLTGDAAVNARDKSGDTALHYAVMGDSNDADPKTRDCRAALVVELLLEAGADRTLVDVHGRTALQFADKEGHTQTAALLRG